jgi:MerR family transcriptional regulator, light-induced transcriptional regulator
MRLKHKRPYPPKTALVARHRAEPMIEERSDPVMVPEPQSAAPEVAVILRVSAVAQRLGIAPPTLRTWERRYGLRPTIRTPGGHRRYTAEDVARLEAMHRLMERGVSPGQAAAAAQAPGPPGDTDSTSTAAESASPVLVDDRADSRAVVRGMLIAARHLDGEALRRTVAGTLRTRGVVNGWNEVVAPALVAIGHAWSTGKLGVEAEHLASECISSQFRSWLAPVAEPISTRPVLLASAPDEQHCLPLLAVAAALAERRISVKLLGARVPDVVLGAAIRRSGPSGAFVWSSQANTGDPAAYVQLSGLRRSPVFVLGGPGWHRRSVTGIRKVRTADTLIEAVDLLAGAARP